MGIGEGGGESGEGTGEGGGKSSERAGWGIRPLGSRSLAQKSRSQLLPDKDSQAADWCRWRVSSSGKE